MKRNRLLLLASAVQLLLLIPLARWVRTHPVNRFDVTMTHNVQKYHNPVFSALSQCCSLLCSWQSMNLAALSLMLTLWRTRMRLEASIFMSAAVLATMFRKLLQRLIARPRPAPPLAHVAKKKSSKSFPSGHALSSIVGGGWLLILCNSLLRRKPVWRKALMSVIAFMIVMAGPSRIYLGEHWTSDVVGGYVFGGAWLSFSFSLYLILQDKVNLSDGTEDMAPSVGRRTG